MNREHTDEYKVQTLVGKCLAHIPFNNVLVGCRDRNDYRWKKLGPIEAFNSRNPAYKKFWVSLSNDVIRVAS